MTFRDALLALGLELPSPANPAGNYVPYVIVGSMVYIAGQVPRRGGKVAIAGKLGRDVDLAK
jgi:enamine deaminase RidA (YjgF/YER057c/UK114 family)